MSIWNSMYTAASGLKANGEAMSVLGDNIANVNTKGFKSSRAQFEDVLGAEMGQGVWMSDVEQLHTQGGLVGTGVNTDLAIQGQGFFVVQGTRQGQTGNFFTRNGQFALDAAGHLVNQQKMTVQGYQVDALGRVSAKLDDMLFPPDMKFAPKPTTEIAMSVNLSYSAAVPPAFAPTSAAETSNYSASTTVYDSLGGAHSVDVFFRNAAPGSWEWYALAEGAEITGGSAGVPEEIASGTLTFNGDGTLDTETTAASSADFINALAGQTISFDFGDSQTTDGGSGAGSTSYDAPFGMSALTQNGYAAGDLSNVSIADDGEVTGAFSNGQLRILGQVALANFNNQSGLERMGGGLYAATRESGQALVGVSNSSGRGGIVAQALEQSNVDLATEFVDMISYQRGFQANSKTIRTADEMLSDIVNLTR